MCHFRTIIVMSDRAPEILPCVVLAKDGNSQETFPVLWKEEARNPDLFFNPSINNLVSKGVCQKPMLS